MGLIVHSIALLPKDSKRDYYVYLLDYGWEGSLGEVLSRNFGKLSDYASRHNFVVLKGTPGSHFDDEVLSWHHINGEKGEDILPAILITNVNPHTYRRFADIENKKGDEDKELMLLIPLRKLCKTEDDVANLINKVIKDLVEKKKLTEFSIGKELKSGIGGALISGAILQPNFAGVGFDLKAFVQKLSNKK
jgi:hypothetical protein